MDQTVIEIGVTKNKITNEYDLSILSTRYDKSNLKRADGQFGNPNHQETV